MKYSYLSIRELPGYLSMLVTGWARIHFEVLIILAYTRKWLSFWYAGDFDRRSVRLQDFSQLSFSLPTAHVAFSCCEFHPMSFCNKLRQIHTSCDTFPSNLAVRKESHRIYPLDTCSAELSTGLDRKDFAESSYCSMQIFYSTVAAVTSFAWFKRSVFNIPNIGTQVFQH